MAHGFKYVRLIKGRYPMFRTKETGDIRLPGPIGSPAFLREYAALLDLREARQQQPEAEAASSWSWLIGKYLASVEFAALADDTQDDYAKTCALLKEELVDDDGRSLMVRFTTKAMLKAVRDDYAATPRKANKVKQMASRLCTWGEENDLVPDDFNPAAKLKRLKRKGGEKEIVDWSDSEIEWIFGAADECTLVALMIFLYTGQRERDVGYRDKDEPGMTWSQFQGEAIRVRTSKTGALLDIPCHPILRKFLEGVRARRKVVSMKGSIVIDEDGRPITINALNGRIRRLVAKVARTHPIPGNRSPHGLRYSACSRMSEGGASHGEIAEVVGHRTLKMALKYANQRVRARAAVEAMPASNLSGTKRESGN